MTRKERQLLCRSLENKNVYLEFGAGGSTIEVLRKTHIKVYSVDSDKRWIDSMKTFYIVKNALKEERLTLYHADIGPVTSFGYPSSLVTSDTFSRYCQGVFDAFDLATVDVIFIDGRFRVACVLFCIKNLHRDCTLLVHDFWDRPHYHAILKYLDVINQVDSLVLLKPKDVFDTLELEKDLLFYSQDPS